MPRLMNVDYGKSKSVLLHSSLTTTTNINTTTALTGTDIDCQGYTKGTFMLQVAAVSTNAMQANIQVKMGTTYAQLATIDADMTTTANVPSALTIDPLPDTIRFQVGALTTSCNVRLKVRGVLKVV